MPPARPRIIDDSRSETSSTVTNLKEKTLLGPTSGLGVTKGKRTALGHNGNNGSHKIVALNGNTSTAAVPLPAAPAAVEVVKDPSLPRTEWNTIPVPILRTYRIAHRLPVPAAFNHPHAELTYKSSDVAQRAPSVVYHRRKQHEQHLQRRKLRQAQQQHQPNGLNGTKPNGTKSKEKAKAKDTVSTTSTADKAALSSSLQSIAQSIELPDIPSSEQDHSSTSSTTPSTYLGPRLPASHLASAVRKHFNAQQLVGGEADTIARFIYVVQQNASSRQVRTEGSQGDGEGYWMGGNGREQRRVDGPGGEVGFRLRFRP